jgi:purine-nucleoside phosphorylase
MGVPVIMLQGRVHFYEGYTVQEVVFLTRLMIILGIKKLLLTHATGATTRNLVPGDIVGIRSQIALNCPDPTSGPGIPDLGVEFSPMEDVFSPTLLQLAKKCALTERISFHWGVSAWKTGRTYESLAEIEFMARMGADVATMSTIPEVMAAAQMGATVLDLALVTDMGAGLGSLMPVSHEEVLRVVELMKEPFGRLITAIVAEMGKLN